VKVKSLHISNILSIEDATIAFDDSGLTLVEGWNYDDNRANGAGKTAIFNALSYALYDDMPRKITAAEIVRKGQKSGFVKAILDVDGVQVEVERKRPGGVTFSFAGKKEDLTQKEFEAKIRLSYDQFLVTAYNAQTFGERFIQLNDTSKKSFLLKLMNLDDIAALKKMADDKVKTLLNSIKEAETAIASDKAKIEAYRDTFPNEEKLKKEIQELEDDILALQSSIKTLSEVTKPNTVEFDQREADIQSKLDKIAQIKAKRSMMFDQYRKLAAKDKPFNGETSCSKCGTEFDISNAVAHHERELVQIRAEMADLKSKLDTLDAVIIKENEFRTSLNCVKNERNVHTSAYQNAKTAAAEYTAKLQLKKQALDNKITMQNNIAEIKNKIKALIDNVTTNRTSIQNLQSEVILQEALSSMYSSTGIPAYVLDSAVDTFNEAVSVYVNMIWPNATYVLKSFKENKDGDVMAKFSEELAINGKQRSIGSLSGGEFRALSLAVDFAIMDVIFKNFSIDVNPIIMDEPFEGLDAAGRETVIELLEKLAANRNILVVDHASEAKAMFTKIIRVEKRAGISRIV
jgi:DNA repair exonuclease SbcCD ATPase subunit